MIFKGGDARGGDLNGFLDQGSRVEGELRFRDTFRVDGQVTGKVVSDGELMVGDTGTVDGEISVAAVFISGTVKGQVKAARRVEISAKGRVLADIETPALVIEEGAFFEGSCSMQPRAQASSEPEAPARREEAPRPAIVESVRRRG
jgi:cytoskeletal protein CcmA (bactofilin family)